ncbi:hypothetical protein, partial [Paraburkholderia sp.]|uniref:hypothetical protein n=1 Tax=Paraburkholderia sp. TaxID=1926495 RepID=UPI003C7DE7DE
NPAASCLQWSCALQAEAVDTFLFFACAHLTRGRCCTSNLIAPIIKSKGVFVFGDDRRGLKSHPFIDFRSEEGKIYRLQDYIGYDEIFKFNENNPDHQEVLVEGFSLRNGLGRFWPTQVTTIDGKVLLDKDKQNTALIRYKDPFDGSLFIMYVVAGSLWIVSAVNTVQIMKKSP